MFTLEDWITYALTLGFSHAGRLQTDALRFLPEVRQMCQADRCHSYGRCWTCPPGCGTLEESAARAAVHSQGLLVQTTGALEDDFDLEGIQRTEAAHKALFVHLTETVRRQLPAALPMGAGACTLCPVCSYPDAPCRFPERAIVSMEAYGLLVSDVCKASFMRYYYGPRTLTFTSCILL